MNTERLHATLRASLLSVLLLAAGIAQEAPRPAFQVASVKRTTANPTHQMFRPQPGGRVIAENAPLQLLIQNAYGVQAYQVVGGPAWLTTDGYDIEAKPEGEVGNAEMRLMLQSLLADRFQLAVHRETRERPVYVLAAAKGEFHPPAPKDDCATAAPGAPPTPGAFPCGRVGINGAPTGLEMNGRKAPMAEFVRILAMLVGHPVIDHTGYSSEFDIHLTFTPDESLEGLPAPPPGAPPMPSDPSRPTLFGALQEQMGLKLSASKGPVEVLVVDRAERPTAN